MLTIVLPETESYSEKEGFIVYESARIRLEHSLYSIALWESKWKKTFFSDKDMRPDEFLHYISCMPVDDDIPERWMTRLSLEHLNSIRDYMADPMTATTIKRRANKPGKKKIVTSELIYFWMIQYGIPFECDRWNFNRLMMLIEVASIESGPSQKMGRKEAIAQQRAICDANRKLYNSRG